MPALLPHQRELFGLIADIAFVNPFSPRRRQAERRACDYLTADSSNTAKPALTRDRLLFDIIIPALETQLDEIEQRGIDQLDAASAADRRLLRHMWLFQLYHRHMEAINAHIQAQLVAGDKPLAFPAARAMLEAMHQRGLDSDEALRYLALLFQLRRAFWFIDQALIGDSNCMQQLRESLWNCVFTSDVRAYEDYLWDRMEDFSTLIIGATGTGKGTAAAAIGRSGLIPFDPQQGRFQYSFTATFVSTNLSEHPESLIESELFGHRKGAFTGAVDDHQGLFSRCSSHGALFLDEIGDVSVPVQLKLLRVLQERHFYPVGSRRQQRFAGRVIAATNQPLQRLIADGHFRADFYYRLCSTVIEVPSLQQRIKESPDELHRMVGLLLQRMTGRAAPELADRVLSSLHASLPADYAWPGNVRELEQAVRRILLGTAYDGSDLDSIDGDAFEQQLKAGELSAEALLAGYCQRLYRQLGSYEAVARSTEMDRRTVKKYVDIADA